LSLLATLMRRQTINVLVEREEVEELREREREREKERERERERKRGKTMDRKLNWR
jgi:hypothetical protein